VLGAYPLGVPSGAVGDHQRGRDPDRCQCGRQEGQQEIVLAGEDAGCEPDTKAINAIASTAVLRKPRLNWRSAISFGGIPKRCRNHAFTPIPPSEPPGMRRPPPSCAQATRWSIRQPLAVALQHTLRVNDPAPGDDKARLREHLERDRSDDHSQVTRAAKVAERIFDTTADELATELTQAFKR
jgi:hypothetical protein